MPIGILITLFRILIFAFLLCSQFPPQSTSSVPFHIRGCSPVELGHKKGHPVGPSSRATRPAPSQKGASRRPVAWCDSSGGPVIRSPNPVVVDRFNSFRSVPTSPFGAESVRLRPVGLPIEGSFGRLVVSSYLSKAILRGLDRPPLEKPQHLPLV